MPNMNRITFVTYAEVEGPDGEPLCNYRLSDTILDFVSEHAIESGYNDVAFMNSTTESLCELGIDTANEMHDSIAEAYICIRDYIIDAVELADVIDAYENQEPDWEL